MCAVLLAVFSWCFEVTLEGLLGAARVLRGRRFIAGFTPFHSRNRAPAELAQRWRTFRLLRGARAGRGPRRQLSFLGERAAIHGTQDKGEHHEHQEAHHLRHQHQPISRKSYWNRAGVAFENKDGSFTFKLDILPQTKFQLREKKPVVKEEAAE